MTEYLLGIDIGGTNVKLGVVAYGTDVQIVRQTSIPAKADETPEEIVGRIVTAAQELVGNCEVTICGVGVGCPGVFERGTGRLLKSPNIPNLVGFPLRDELSRRLGLPVEVQNDANAAVLGELRFGSTKEVKDLILLTLGTGIGGGVVVDGRLLQGADNAAAELGHLCVQPGGAVCGCGKKGCMEAYVGAAGILRIAKRRLAAGKESCLDRNLLSTEAIAKAAESGDTVAQEILREVGDYLGRGIALLIDTFNPEKVLLGGGASAAIEYLRPGITAAVDENASFPVTRDRAKIERAAFPGDINILGAVATFLSSRPESIECGSTTERIRIGPSGQRHGEEKYVLGVHIGASSQHVGILDFSGKVIACDEVRESPAVRHDKSYEELADDALDAIERTIAEAEKGSVTRDQLRGVGVVVPAPVDAEQGRVFRPPALPGLEGAGVDVDLHERLQQRIGLSLPVCIENDANGACLLERYFGMGKNDQHYVTILLCTGLGGAMMLNGKLHRGDKHTAGEFGHITVQPNGKHCKCGSKGCLETVASGAALLQATRAKPSAFPLHYLDLIKAAADGDKRVKKLFKTMGQYLGIGIASIVNILNPSKVILSGQLARASEFFMPSAEIELRNRAFARMGCTLAVSELLEHLEVRAGLSTFLHYHRQGE